MAEEVGKGNGSNVVQSQGGGEDIRRRLAKLDEVVAQIDRTRRGGGIIRICVTLLLLSSVLVAGARILSIYNKIRQNQAAYETAFRTEGEAMLRTSIFTLRQIAEESWPVWRKAMEDDIRAHRDEMVAVLNQQRDLFINEAKEGLREGLEREAKSLIQAQEAQLVELFPKLKDEKVRHIIVDNLRSSLTEVAAKLMEKDFDVVLAEMGEVHEEAILMLPTKEQQDSLRMATSKLFKHTQSIAKPLPEES